VFHYNYANIWLIIWYYSRDITTLHCGQKRTPPIHMTVVSIKVDRFQCIELMCNITLLIYPPHLCSAATLPWKTCKSHDWAPSA